MNNDLVDKVALILADEDADSYAAVNQQDSDGNYIKSPTRTFYLNQASVILRVVREALAEPDEAMLRAGSNALAGWVAPAMHSADAWRAMLAASPLGRVE